MIVIGLTGSIGMGKSAVARMFKRMGIPVHDSDQAVHRALLPKGEAFEEVAVTFKEAWDKKKHVIDRKKLGEIVFHDPQKLKELESILHPVAVRSQMEFVRHMQRTGKKIVVLEIPLLFETGAQSRVDYTICVTAPPVIQKRRVLRRKGMTMEKFQKILARQMPDQTKTNQSDFVIQTGIGYAHTYQALKKAIKTIQGGKTHA